MSPSQSLAQVAGVQNALLSTANLFPGKEKFVTTILVGCFQLNRLLANSRVCFIYGFPTLFVIHGTLVLMLIIVVNCVVPDAPFLAAAVDGVGDTYREIVDESAKVHEGKYQQQKKKNKKKKKNKWNRERQN